MSQKYALTEQQLNDWYTANKIIDMIRDVMKLVDELDNDEAKRVFKLCIQMLENEKE